MAGRDRMTIEEVVRQVLRDEHGDVIRESVRAVARELMEAEVSELIGAEHGERTEDRATHRNGYRPRRWDTRAGEIELQIPKIRQGSYFPAFLQPRKRSEQALVVGRAAGLCVRRVDPAGRSARREPRAADLASREVSRIAGLLDEQVAGVPRAAVGGPLPVSVRRREGREGPRRRPRGAQVRRHRARRPRDRPARDHRPRRRRGRDRGVLARVPRGPGRARPGRRAAGDQRRAPGPEGGAGPGARRAVAALHRALPARPARPRPQRPARRARRDRSARSSPPPDGDAGRAGACATRSPSSSAGCRRSPRCSRRPKTTSWPSTPSRPSTGPSSARRTRWSASTARSAGAPTSSASSPTTPP